MSKSIEYDFGKSGSRAFSSQGEFENFILNERGKWLSLIQKLGSRSVAVNGTVNQHITQSNVNEIHSLIKSNVIFLTDTIYWNELNRNNFIENDSEAGRSFYIIGFISAFNDFYSSGKFFADVSRLYENSKFTNGVVSAVVFFNNEKITQNIRDASDKLLSYNENFESTVSGLDKLRGNIDEYRKESVLKIQELEKALREDMLIKSTSDYWSLKSDSHKNRYKYLAIGCGIYALSSLFLILWGARELPKILTTDHNLIAGDVSLPILGDTSNFQYYTIFVAISLLTLVFWGARILVRTMFSEQHLATDSEEKKVFSETYLSLIKEGSATKEERILMLTSLFRNSSDGIVRDDNSSDIGPAAIASKLLMPQNK